MGKIDDMRRQREARHAQDLQDAKDRATAGGADESPPSEPPAPVAAEAEPTVRVSSSSRRPTADLEGVCSVCGKVRSVQGGTITAHQKGLGKMCPGSRKPPA